MTSSALADASSTAANARRTRVAATNARTTPAPVLGGTAGQLKPGQIVAATYADFDEFLLAVVLDNAGNDPMVALLDDDHALATDLDLIIDQAVLGYPAVVQTWNTGLLLAEQIHDVLGHLPADSHRALQALVAAEQHGDPTPDDPSTGVPVLATDDPRLAAREEARERVAPFWQPAQLLTETPTFGALIRNARAREDVTQHDLAGLVDQPRWLERLEEDELDLQSTVSARVLLRLLDRLHVTLHEGTARLLGAAVADTCGPTPAQELRLARRRTRSARPAEPSPEDRRAAAQHYVDALWREAGNP
jgi:transcriptional regulator with XRE-family HTH domain